VGPGDSIRNVTSLAARPTGRDGGAHMGHLLHGLTKAAPNPHDLVVRRRAGGQRHRRERGQSGRPSVYLRMANGFGATVIDTEVVEGEQLDETLWGDPVAWLASARLADVTGEIHHAYTFGETWGRRYQTPREWSPAIRHILGRDNLKAR
jgi:hypothetical protein